MVKIIKIKRKELEEFLVLLFIFILSPFAAYLLSFYKILSNKKRYLIYICLYYGFFGLIYLNKETNDITVHYQWFNKIRELDNKEFILYLSQEKDWIIFIFYRILGYFTNNYRYIGFFSAMISYGIPFYLISDFSFRQKLSKSEKFLFLVFFLGISPSYKFAGMRSFNAICIISLGIYYIEILKNKKGYIWIILSPLLHISTLPIVLIYFISKQVKITRLKILLILILSIVGMGFSNSIFMELIKISEKYYNIFPNIFRSLNSYLNKPNDTKVEIHYFIKLITFGIYYAITIISYYFEMKFKKIRDFRIIFFLNLCILFNSFFSFSWIIYERFVSSLLLLQILSLIYIYKNFIKQKKIVYIILLEISIISYLYLVRIEYLQWNYKLLVSNIFQISRENNYLKEKREIKLERNL